MRPIYTIIVSILLLTCIKSDAQVDSLHQSPLFIGQSNSIKILDSLIEHASSMALNKNDYQQDFKNAFANGVNTDSVLTQVGIRFFTHLAYGNRPPKLDYSGAKFKLNVFDIPKLLKSYIDKNQLNVLAQNLLNNSKEVHIILDSLNMNQRKLIPNKEKIQILEKAANDYRWLNALKKTNRFIVVNIPSAQLKAYDSNKLILSMRVIVGKSLTQTNTLSSQINRIILNPYWMVPKSIIQNEMYPKFKEDNTYFIKNGYTVINANYKEVDLSKMDVSKYSKDNFPFIIRQGTGLDNSLGLLKIEFDSPSSIYLHDTPQKDLFATANRFYSHGCVRMEKPIEVGKWLLQNNRVAIDTFDFTKPEKYPKPRPIPVTIPTQVIVWYSLIDFDKKGKLKFYKDIYKINQFKVDNK
jgi:lipoprotein-anchoring transpeptidase ErfK/SrfK